eukprot:7202617-Prymnesium_polylepis.2
MEDILDCGVCLHKHRCAFACALQVLLQLDFHCGDDFVGDLWRTPVREELAVAFAKRPAVFDGPDEDWEHRMQLVPGLELKCQSPICKAIFPWLTGREACPVPPDVDALGTQLVVNSLDQVDIRAYSVGEKEATHVPPPAALVLSCEVSPTAHTRAAFTQFTLRFP